MGLTDVAIRALLGGSKIVGGAVATAAGTTAGQMVQNVGDSQQQGKYRDYDIGQFSRQVKDINSSLRDFRDAVTGVTKGIGVSMSENVQAFKTAQKYSSDSGAPTSIKTSTQSSQDSLVFAVTQGINRQMYNQIKDIMGQAGAVGSGKEYGTSSQSFERTAAVSGAFGNFGQRTGDNLQNIAAMVQQQAARGTTADVNQISIQQAMNSRYAQTTGGAVQYNFGQNAVRAMDEGFGAITAQNAPGILIAGAQNAMPVYQNKLRTEITETEKLHEKSTALAASSTDSGIKAGHEADAQRFQQQLVTKREQLANATEMNKGVFNIAEAFQSNDLRLKSEALKGGLKAYGYKDGPGVSEADRKQSLIESSSIMSQDLRQQGINLSNKQIQSIIKQDDHREAAEKNAAIAEKFSSTTTAAFSATKMTRQDAEKTIQEYSPVGAVTAAKTHLKNEIKEQNDKDIQEGKTTTRLTDSQIEIKAEEEYKNRGFGQGSMTAEKKLREYNIQRVLDTGKKGDSGTLVDALKNGYTQQNQKILTQDVLKTFSGSSTEQQFSGGINKETGKYESGQLQKYMSSSYFNDNQRTVVDARMKDFDKGGKARAAALAAAGTTEGAAGAEEAIVAAKKAEVVRLVSSKFKKGGVGEDPTEAGKDYKISTTTGEIATDEENKQASGLWDRTKKFAGNVANSIPFEKMIFGEHKWGATDEAGGVDTSKIGKNKLEEGAVATTRLAEATENLASIFESFTTAMSNMMSGMMGSPGAAIGANISAGLTNATVVGERGPELFIPKQDGEIISNNEAASLMRKRAFGGPVKKNTVYTVGEGSGPEMFVSTMFSKSPALSNNSSRYDMASPLEAMLKSIMGESVEKGATRVVGSSNDANLSTSTATAASSNIAMPVIKGNDFFGKVAAFFESGANPAAISSGKGDLGGKSYGAFQLSSSQGSVNTFLQKSGFQDQFANFTVGTPEFDKQWETMAQNPEFVKAQSEYATNGYYKPAVANLKKAGLDLESRGRAVQEMIMSTSVQYGGGGVIDVMTGALAGQDISNMSDSQIISKISEYKKNTVSSWFRSSSADVQKGVANRIGQEELMLQKIAGEEAQAAAAPQPVTERANGGIFMKGQPMIVGERQPEMIIPQSSGSVLSGANTQQLIANLASAQSSMRPPVATPSRQQSSELFTQQSSNSSTQQPPSLPSSSTSEQKVTVQFLSPSGAEVGRVSVGFGQQDQFIKIPMDGSWQTAI